MVLKGVLMGTESTVSFLEGRGDAVVGVTLVLIGVNGLRKAARWRPKAEADELDGCESGGHGVEHERAATVGMGVVHGFTGTGHLLGVVPALTLPSLGASLVYLGGFCVGTFVLMGLFTAGVGEASLQAAAKFKIPNLPQVCARLSSVVAVVLGVMWIVAGVSYAPHPGATLGAAA